MAVYFDKLSERWICEFDRRMSDKNGEVRRVRKRKRLPAGTSETQAKILGKKYEANQYTKAEIYDDDQDWNEYVDSLVKNQKSWLYVTIVKMRNRSTSASRPCTVTTDHIVEKLRQSSGRCAVTGIKFNIESCNGSGKRPFYHSVDRIDSSIGYVPTNIRIVCLAANIAMLHWGEIVLSELATGYVMRKYGLSQIMV